jgi:hypothetical protein
LFRAKELMSIIEGSDLLSTQGKDEEGNKEMED